MGAAGVPNATHDNSSSGRDCHAQALRADVCPRLALFCVEQVEGSSK